MMNPIITILVLSRHRAFLLPGYPKMGNTRGLTIGIGVWILICLGSYFITTAVHFYIAGFFIGMVMGGVQSLSRSTYSRFIPKTNTLLQFLRRLEKAMMCGLVLWGYLDNLTGSMRNSILVLVVWFGLGLILMLRVQRRNKQ
ncbi:MAG: MFS transporter [Lewinellaceae bacterium]|nr:MFS transporter [Lewinellaceae bacterium]